MGSFSMIIDPISERKLFRIFSIFKDQTGLEPSQRSLHNAPTFRLLLKVVVNGTHQCDSHNFCGASCSNNQNNNHHSLLGRAALPAVRLPTCRLMAIAKFLTEVSESTPTQSRSLEAI